LDEHLNKLMHKNSKGDHNLSVLLQDTENLCNEIYQILENVSFKSLDNINDLKDRIEAVKKSVSVSKNKFMVRTDKGKELSNHAKTTAMELKDSLNELQKNQESEASKELVKSVISNVNRLEKDAQKVDMHWRSYEAAIT